jgi:hypothetical protein
VTQEGELLPYCQHELTVGGDGEEDKIFFIWPTTIVHKIDPTSPLYVLSASEMIRERFEIVVILEGEKFAHVIAQDIHILEKYGYRSPVPKHKMTRCRKWS